MLYLNSNNNILLLNYTGCMKEVHAFESLALIQKIKKPFSLSVLPEN